MEGTAHSSEDTASPSTQPNLVQGFCPLHCLPFGWCPKWDIRSCWQHVCFSPLSFGLGWDPKHFLDGGQWIPSGDGFCLFVFQKSRYPLGPMSGGGVSSAHLKDLDEERHSKKPGSFWRSEKDESVSFSSKWEAELYIMAWPKGSIWQHHSCLKSTCTSRWHFDKCYCVTNAGWHSKSRAIFSFGMHRNNAYWLCTCLHQEMYGSAWDWNKYMVSLSNPSVRLRNFCCG